ncbi:MAG: hypothetical protein JWR18_4224 [Segetibacter sp.]|jgi:hypothetical protein|nr:hypothetical protein [Segetibacter sp.]
MMPVNKNSISSFKWVLISGVGFVLFLATAFLFGIYSDKLNFVNASAYFFLLIPLALVCAGFLFGALRSHAKYTGKAYAGTIELGGPVVVLALIILMGFKFRPTEKEFSYTVNFFEANDTTEIIRDGSVELFFGTARLAKSISEGQSVFNELPSTYKGKGATLITKAKGYVTKRQAVVMPFGNTAQDIFLDKIKDSVSIHGLVKDARKRPVKEASLVFADGLLKTTSDQYGNFNVSMPFKDGDEVPLRIYIKDKLEYDNLVVLSNNVSLNIQLP